MFKWLYKRIFNSFLEYALSVLSDKEFVTDVFNPLIDKIIDRQFSRVEGRIGKMASTIIPKGMPKMDLGSILGAIAMQKLGGIFGGQDQTQNLNSSSTNRLQLEVK